MFATPPDDHGIVNQPAGKEGTPKVTWSDHNGIATTKLSTASATAIRWFPARRRAVANDLELMIPPKSEEKHVSNPVDAHRICSADDLLASGGQSFKCVVI